MMTAVGRNRTAAALEFQASELRDGGLRQANRDRRGVPYAATSACRMRSHPAKAVIVTTSANRVGPPIRLLRPNNKTHAGKATPCVQSLLQARLQNYVVVTVRPHGGPHAMDVDG